MKSTKSKIVLKGLCLLIVSCMACMLHGATFTVNTAELGDITIVEADPYKSGDTPGNTLRVDGEGFWGTTTANGGDNLWRERAISAFTTGYESLAGATDRLYEVDGNDRLNAPELVTTVAGLNSSSYEVFLIYVYRNDGNSADAEILGGLESPAATLCNHNSFVSTLGTATGVWSVGVTPIGTVVGDTLTVYAKGTTAGGRCDYIAVAYKHTATAWDPAPEDSAIDLETNATLSWNTGLTSSGAVNPAITKHQLYMVEAEVGEDPNVADGVPTEITDENPTNIAPPITLNTDKVYIWRVDEVTASETIIGAVWSFETTKTIPSFEPPYGTNPEDLTKVFAGEEFVLTASAGTTGGVGSEISYQWYFAPDPNSSIPVVDEADHISGAATSTLTITAIADDQGVYFCTATNDEGTGQSQTASVEVKRLIAHYKFDDDFVDAVGGINGTSTASFIEGIDGSAVDLDGSQYVDLGLNGLPNSSVGGGLSAGTFSIWLNAPTTNFFSFTGAYNNSDSTGFDCWYAEGNQLAFITRNAAGASVGLVINPLGSITNGKWQLITYTWDTETGDVAVYINGLLRIAEKDAPISGFSPWDNSMIIGGVNYSAGNDPSGPSDFFTGALDDCKIYNYALDAYEVAQLFVDFNPGTSFCIEKPVYDLNDDCKVDISDISVFAMLWLECGMIPTSGCF